MELAGANPFSKVSRIETMQELLDLAFSRAMKIAPPQMRGAEPLVKNREYERNRVNTAANVLADRLQRIIAQFPSLNSVHPLYLELANVLLADPKRANGVDNLRKALGGLQGTVHLIRDVEQEINEALNGTFTKTQNIELRTSAFGRFSSIIYQIEPHLEILRKAQETLSELPGFNPMQPSVVVAGVPNVGKSSFVRNATSGKPNIGSYPFTTKRLVFGHRKFGFITAQFCDTPGILDRSLKERNEIELMAIAALKHISDILLVIIDPSISATYPVEQQLRLVGEFADFYPQAELMLVVNKMDLIDEEEQGRIRSQVKSFLSDGSLNIDPVHGVHFISSFNPSDISKVMDAINHVIKTKLLRTSKFQVLADPEIAEDQLTLEEVLDEDIIFEDDDEYLDLTR